MGEGDNSCIIYPLAEKQKMLSTILNVHIHVKYDSHHFMLDAILSGNIYMMASDQIDCLFLRRSQNTLNSNNND